jgi:hypothetical protein
MKKSLLFIALGVTLTSATKAYCQEIIKIPFKPDPAITIDGDLNDWNTIPNKQILNSKEHVTYGADKWKGAADLSATVQLSWRPDALYVAANVTDDILRQTQRGANIWKGDHVELYLDTAPDTDAGNTAFGARQFQIGLSPGNFNHSGDALADIAPEAYAFLPAGISLAGSQVAAQRTVAGYTIEASIPWNNFDFKPQVGLPLGVEVSISDTDGVEAMQEKMMTIGAAAWKRNRGRLLPAILANADGSAPAPITSTPIFDGTSLKINESKTITFDAPDVPQGYEALLSLQARLDTPTVKGYTPALEVTLNGKALDVKNLANKVASEQFAYGQMHNMTQGNKFAVPYTPDFDAIDKDTKYGLRNNVKAALFELRITGLLKKNGNVLVIKNAPLPGVDKTLVVGNVKLLYRIPPIPKVPQGPPVGALSYFAPQIVKPVNYQIKQSGSQEFSLQLNNKHYTFYSQYSTPAGKWVNGSNQFFTVKRQLEKKDGWLVVRDVFTNLTDRNLPLMHRDQVRMKCDKVWLGGFSPNSLTGTSTNPSNPTTFGVQGKQGIGLLPLDDVSQVHITNFSTPDSIGLMDNALVLKPKSTFTAEWAIVPISSSDHFDFINATRRLLDVNFQIDGPDAFLRADPRSTGKWTDQQIIDFAKFKDAKYLCLILGYPYYKGLVPHGTAFQQIDHTAWTDAIARRRRLLPDVKQIAYFHCYIDVTSEAPEKYNDSRLLLPNDEQGNYGLSTDKIFIPTLTDSYGSAIAKSLDLLLDQMKLQGIFWDEMDYSRYRYTYGDQWDGYSANIDPTTMKITRLKSSVTLLSQPWRLLQARRIMKSGVLIANGGLPATRTMRNLHYMAFNETGSIANCVNSQLYTLIALGDHLTERNEEDAYHDMLKALDYGCLYYWYSDLMVIPTYHTLTQYMYPFTPVELHHGYVIGKERILTNRSGIFGWNDNSKHEVHVFDNTGREVNLKDIKAPTSVKTFEKDGKTWTEIRIAENWSAAIVRK